MPTTNLAHERFVAAMKAGSDRITAYKVAYPNSTDAAARANVCRLLKNQYVHQMLSENDAALDEQATKATILARIQRLEAYYDQQAGFLKIIEGGLVEKVRNGEKRLEKPTVTDKLKAARFVLNLKDSFTKRYPQYRSVEETWENG
ncbi:hypothetical protein [Polluticoccus soli]|uniref:hypothetical protein n=1 Tax=Polluticoccus soli TaxID=3034150 RepID=UPI0023E12DE6|nr:hypothetical protein [Flavipsychrobacter sp. JY13-12]